MQPTTLQLESLLDLGHASLAFLEVMQGHQPAVLCRPRITYCYDATLKLFVFKGFAVTGPDGH